MIGNNISRLSSGMGGRDGKAVRLHEGGYLWTKGVSCLPEPTREQNGGRPWSAGGGVGHHGRP